MADWVYRRPPDLRPQIVVPIPQAAGGTTINATPGTFAWVGSTQTIDPAVVNQAVGTWSWAGSTASFSQVVAATPGTWSWVGSTATFTQLLDASPGTWSWAGSAASFTQLLDATPGTWSWAGTTADFSQLISAAPGTWTWAGTTATIDTGAGVTTIDAIPGTWSWAGAVTFSQLIDSAVGAFSWAGSSQTFSQALDAVPGAFSWAGSTAGFSQLIDAAPGLWSWAGSVQGIVSTVTIDATPGLWGWAGTTATFATPSESGSLGFEMLDWPVHARKGDRTRRGIVYVEPDEEPKPRKRITKAEVDLRRIEAAKQEANRIISEAAAAHAGAGLKEARRYAEVRTALKPLAPALGDWNWVAIYQTLYAKALAEQIRAELALQDRIEAEDDAIIALLLNPQTARPLLSVETEQDEEEALLMLLLGLK